MTSIIRASLRAHARRLASIGIAVCLGVAFLAGTLVLGDTLRKNFDRLFDSALGRADVVVRSADTLSTDVEAAQGLIDVSLGDTVAAVEGVRTVEPQIEGFGQITGADGEKLGGQGPPTFAGNWITDPELNPYELVEGRAPAASEEVVINRGAAKDGKLAVGDVTTVATPEPVTVTIVGIATFGGEDGLGPTTFTGFTLAGAEQHVTGRPGAATSLLVAAEDGADLDALREQVAFLVPANVEAITGADLSAEASDDINADFLGFLRGFLTAFAVVALLVATFSIYNTFSIVVAHRLRESALLRAVGASRRQLLVSVLIEGAVVGVVASLVGLAAGFGLAGLLKGLFDAFGFALPAGGLAITPSILWAPVAGIVVTVLAGLGPALRGSRVAPLATMRGVDADRSATSVRRMATGGLLLAGGIALALAGVAGDSLGMAGLGAVASIVGAVVLGPVVVAPVAAVLGRAMGRTRGLTAGLAPKPRKSGLPARTALRAGRVLELGLAGRNVGRSPRRTSATASALLIGVGVVTLFTGVAASLRASLDDRVQDVVTADLLISGSAFGGGGLSPGLATALNSVPEVDTAVGVATGPIAIDGRTSQATIADPALVAGQVAVDVGTGFSVSDTVAEDRGWLTGDVVPVTFPDGATEPLEVTAVYETGDPLVNGYFLPRAAWEAHAVQTIATRVLISLADGVALEDGRRAVEAAAAPFSPPDVQTKAEFVEEAGANVSAMLGLVYAMLALAIIIAVMGIANTLSLSIHERTRELGLLRAVGQTRRQLRAMVRWESVVIALLGTAGGIGLGLFLGWAAVTAASGSGTVQFALPTVQLLPIVVVGAAAGVLAAIRPARRAARLPVLQAVAR